MRRFVSQTIKDIDRNLLPQLRDVFADADFYARSVLGFLQWDDDEIYTAFQNKWEKTVDPEQTRLLPDYKPRKILQRFQRFQRFQRGRPDRAEAIHGIRRIMQRFINPKTILTKALKDTLSTVSDITYWFINGPKALIAENFMAVAECIGTGELLMSMFVVKHSDKHQEHIYIHANPLRECVSQPKNLSLCLHSFAGDQLHCESIVIAPYLSMRTILYKSAFKEIIRYVPYSIPFPIEGSYDYYYPPYLILSITPPFASYYQQTCLGRR